MLVRKTGVKPIWFLTNLYVVVFFVILIVLILFTIFFSKIIYIVEDDTQKRNETYLNSVIKDFNDSISTAERTCLDLYFSSTIRYFLDKPFLNKNDEHLKAIQEIIHREIIRNDRINSIYIYYQKQNIIITDKSIISYDDFKNNKWYEYGQHTFGERTLTPVWSVNGAAAGESKNIDVISVIQYFPVYTSDNMGAVVVNIDISKEKNALIYLDSIEKSTSFLLNSAGMIQFSGKSEFGNANIYNILGRQQNMYLKSGTQTQFRNELSMIYGSNKTYFKWSIIQFLPKNIIKLQYNTLLKYFFIILALYIATFIFLIYYGKRISKGSIVNGKRVKNIFNVIDNENRMLLHGLFDTILNTPEPLNKEKMKEISELGIPISDYFVLLIKRKKNNWNETAENQHNNAGSVVNLIYKGINNYASGYCICRNPDEFIAIVNVPGSKTCEDVNKLATNIAEYLISIMKEYYECNIGIAAGKYVESIEQLSISLETARNMDKHIWFNTSDCIVFYEEECKSRSKYLYNTKLESRLIDSIINGNEEEANENLRIFIDTLKSESHFSPETVYHGMMQLTSSIFKIFQNNFDLALLQKNKYDYFNDPLKHFMSLDSLQSVQVWLSEVIVVLCDCMWDIRGASNENLMTNIKEYISRNLDKSPTLTMVADEFKISESYLSRIFKQKTGENFLEFRNKKRISKAKEIMKETSASISDISFMSGFENVQTFIRVFKGIEGMTPGVYKELRQKEVT